MQICASTVDLIIIRSSAQRGEFLFCANPIIHIIYGVLVAEGVTVGVRVSVGVGVGEGGGV